MNLKPYSNYKDSGIDWLSTVPSHWEINKIGRISEFTVGWTPSTGIQENFEGDNKWANISDLGPRTIYDTAKRISDHAVEISRLKVSPRGSLLFGFKLSVGDVSFAGTEMYTNEAIATFLESKRVTLRYAYYAYPLFIIENAGENIYGARILNQERIRNAKITFPPIGEQRVIADFLDRETAEIDAFIADQERLIGLLEERRAATITHAVTKGLDPNAPMKDSGIDWLGYVPRHWQIARLKNSIQDAKNGVWGLEPDGSELDLRCVRVADFDRPRLSIHDRNATLRKIPLNEQKGRILNKGDLLLEKSGGGEKSPVGFVVRYDRDEPAVCSNFVARLALRPGMDSQFWTYLHSMLYSRRLTQRSIKQTTGIQNLDQASYFDELVAFPTHQEQCAIAEFLDREMAELDAAVSDAREAIALSQERRAALISAAVTGQLDVSQAQSRDSAGEVLGQGVRV